MRCPCSPEELVAIMRHQIASRLAMDDPAPAERIMLKSLANELAALAELLEGADDGDEPGSAPMFGPPSFTPWPPLGPQQPADGNTGGGGA